VEARVIPWQTVLPLSHLTVPSGQEVAFAGDVVLGRSPDWVPTETMLKDCSTWDRTSAETATAALVARYEATSFGDPDPNWKGPKPRSIQETKGELCLLANLALWIARPNPAGFRVLLHGRLVGEQMMAQRVECGFVPLLCLPEEVNNRPTAEDLKAAAKVHASLVAVGRKGSIWTAARSVWASLHVNREDVRYLFFWVALEALFGPDSPGEITHRIAERLALFLENDPAKAKDLFKSIKVAYGFRSKIAHGDVSGDSEEGITRMAQVELWARTALLTILTDDQLVKIFSEKGREAFLTDLLFQA
jgi:hypothetical protein